MPSCQAGSLGETELSAAGQCRPTTCNAADMHSLAAPEQGGRLPPQGSGWLISTVPCAQLEEVRRRYEAARRRRQREEPRLLAALRELQVGPFFM